MKALIISVLLAFVPFAFGSAAENPLGQVVFVPRPDKLPEAARQHLAGSGLFVIYVDMATGKVKSIQIEKSTGHVLLDRSAIQTFQKFRFKPGTVRRVVAPISYTASSRVG